MLHLHPMRQRYFMVRSDLFVEGISSATSVIPVHSHLESSLSFSGKGQGKLMRFSRMRVKDAFDDLSILEQEGALLDWATVLAAL